MQQVHFQIFSLSTLPVYILQLLCRTCKMAVYSIVWRLNKTKKMVNRMFARWYHRTFDSKFPLQIICKTAKEYCYKNRIFENAFHIVYPFYPFMKGSIFIYRISVFTRLKSKCAINISNNFKTPHYQTNRDCIKCRQYYVHVIHINQYIILNGYKNYRFSLFYLYSINNNSTKVIICANVPK